jgi:hypothetical protein
MKTDPLHGLSYHRKVALIAALSLILSVPGLWVRYYNIDELTNSIYARFIGTGELGLSDFVGNTYILTHYLYAWVVGLFGWSSMAPMHVVHALWKCLTVFAVAWAGDAFGDRRTGAWSALFYGLGSVSFLSKDFHTPSAESFSLLPAALGAGFFFRALNRGSARDFFLSGVLIAIASLFKAPMGITAAAMGVTLLVRYRRFWRDAPVNVAGFVLTLALPALLVTPFGEGIRLMAAKVEETNSTYIQSYEGLSYLYSVLKLAIRTSIVLGSLFAASAFALQNRRALFRVKLKQRDHWLKIFFVSVWLCALVFAVSLGGRVFYHYYVFLLVPLALLAGMGVKQFDARVAVFERRKGAPDAGFDFMRFVRRRIGFFLAVPALAFSLEGALNVSTHPPKVSRVVAYVKEHTAPDDRIYVWGNVPQIYFDSERLPSTVYFWSDILAGTSPGSPAMEYVRATGESLTLTQQLSKDFQAKVFDKMPASELSNGTALSAIGEDELFTLDELLTRIDQPYWRKVFRDFFRSPPKLFIDTSPTNIRGFGFSPISKFELLKRFILDNYEPAGVIDDMVVYRLHGGAVSWM